MLQMEPPRDDPEQKKAGAHSNEIQHVVEKLISLVEYMKSVGEFRLTQNKECHGLVRRLNLILPLLEEIRYQNNTSISQRGIESLKKLKEAFRHAKKLLVTCHDGSKIYLVLESEAIMGRFDCVYNKIFRSLEDMPYHELGVTEEEIEQVELVRSQIKRSKRRNQTPNMELKMDLMVLFSTDNVRDTDTASIERLANTLGLRSIQELRDETLAVRKLSKKRKGISEDTMRYIVEILGKFKRFAGVAENDDPPEETAMNNNVVDKCLSSAIPHEFLCPITLEIMTDPVIVSTGQTYERQSIQEWLDKNHRTCPKTGQVLSHLNKAPNVALKNLIRQWCEKNNIQLTLKEKPHISSPSHENSEITSIVRDLSVGELDVQREAVTKIRLLSKESPENRVIIAKSGGIPPLVQLLSYPDAKIQEHAVTALLNLSIDECNKKLISEEQPFPAIIKILQSGTVGAKENSAAALYSLSMLDENKVTIGSLNVVRPLVELLRNGTTRGKKDGINALFNLSFDENNKIKAIEGGVIAPLLEIVGDKRLNMMTNEAFSLLRLLASIPKGRKRIGQQSFVEVLVSFCKDGSPKNKECAVTLLLELSIHNSNLMLAALQFGVYDPIAEIARNGTSRAQRKAYAILQLMNRAEQI